MDTKARIADSELELRGIGKLYGSQAAVDDVSLAVRPGEFVSLLGPSGSGKTTTLMMIAGFIVPDRGRILVGGSDITALPAHRRNLGMVYQQYALFPHMTVAENVAFPLKMRRMDRGRIAEAVNSALELVQLRDKSERNPRQLSGGQQQRVALARALVFEPPLLLMDEPLGALDKKLRGDMQAEIKTIQRRVGITTIYVTHDQEEALSMSDRVVVMRAGRVEQVASPTAIYDRPANGFVADFIGAANLLPVTVEHAGRDGLVRTAGGFGLAASVTEMAVGDAAIAVLRPERIMLSRQAPPAEGATVEDVSFSGGAWRYRCRLVSGEHLMITQGNTGEEPPGVGQKVGLAWRPDDIWITKASAA